MAAGAITVLNAALGKILSGVFDLDGGAFHMVLTTNAQIIDATFTGTSGQALYSDLTAEVSDTGTGYTEGGSLMANVGINVAGGVATVVADPVTWASANFTAKYGLICRADDTGDPTDILAFFDMETTDPDGRIAAGDFMVSLPDGAFDLQRA